jgi:hypothetical protein
MSKIMRDLHANGGVQSEVRLAAARARRRAPSAGWRKERILLLLYSWVGYGERISLPLVILLATSLVATSALFPWSKPNMRLTDAAGAFAALWSHVVLSPLSFFHVLDPPKAAGFAGQVLLAVYQLIGVVMVFFCLASIRRVAKAE